MMKNRCRAASLLLFSSSVLFSAVVQADKIIHYTFDVDNGTDVANSGTGTSGILVGGATYGPGQDASFGTAFYGNRTGLNDGHVLTQYTGDDLGMGAGGVYTAMAWMNWTGSSGNVDHMVFGQDDGNGTGNTAQLHHGIRDDSVANVHFGHWGNDIIDAGTAVAGEWIHVAWQYDGTEAVVFVNGVETAREAKGGITSSALNVLVGAHTRDGTAENLYQSFNGAIDDVKVFDEVLSAGEVALQMVPGDDLDGDGLSDADEVAIHMTDPNDDDSDDDGMKDGIEVANMLDPNSALGDDGAAGDPDGDTLSNIDELLTHLTNPQSDDTDLDTLKDNDEISVHGTNPRLADSDLDGLDDADEISRMIDPNNPDTDGDTLSDGDEVLTHFTDPDDADSDDDTFDDNVEINSGSSPNDPLSIPAADLPDPLLYYTFDVDNGTTVENLGTLATDGTTSGGVTYGPGQDLTFGTAFVGNRETDSDALIKTGFTGDQLGFGAGGVYTAMAWVNWAGSSSGNLDHMVFGQATNAAGNVAQLHHGIRDDSPANVHFGGWGRDIADAGTVTPTEWTHLAWQYTGTEAVVYVNGVETSRLVRDNISDPSFEVIIGGHSRDSNLAPEPGQSFNGSIDEVRIYGEALNPVQLALAMIPDPSSAQGLAITDISVDDANSMVSLTFLSRPGRSYTLKSSLTLDNDFQEIDDSVAADPVANITTHTFPIPSMGGVTERKIFFRLEEN